MHWRRGFVSFEHQDCAQCGERMPAGSACVRLCQCPSDRPPDRWEEAQIVHEHCLTEAERALVVTPKPYVMRKHL